jgi:putative ABC transport system permease protein
MNLESIRIAIRGVIANRMRSALTMLGIFIGVGAVIVLVAVGAGSAVASEARLKALGSNTLTVTAGGFGQGNRGSTQSRNIALTAADVTALSDKTQAPDIAAVVPIISAPSQTATYNGASATIGSTIGTTPNYATVRSAPVQSGTFLTQDDIDNHANVAVVGTTVAQNLLGAGANPNALLGQPVKIGAQTYVVSGILKSKGSNGTQDQDDIVILPETTIQDHIVGDTGTISQAVVQATNAAATTPAQAEISSILVARHNGATTSSFRILNQASLLQTQDANNRTFTVLLASVAAISLLVGGIGVMNIMLVTVTERTREIGIRKAIGAPKSAIVGQFLVEAVLLSLMGGVLGVAGGLAGSHFKIVGIQPVVQPYSVILAVVVAVATGLFFGIYPASRAAALRPIEALRYE